MRVKTLRFKSGSKPGADALELNATAVTVFVGPNYSGKSQAVAEIAARLQSGDYPHGRLVLESIGLEPLTETEADLAMSSMVASPNPGEIVHPGHEMYGFKHDRFQLSPNSFKAVLTNPEGHKNNFAQWYSRFKTLLLNGENRISLINNQSAGDLQNHATSSFQTIFRNDNLRERLSQIIFKAFGLYLTVDPTNVGELRLRLSKIAPPSPEVERGLTDASIQFHGSATLVNSTSDGAKAFVGIVLEILAGDPNVLLIDEPEAFLHPSLAFQLGHEISNELSKSHKQMFVSTHSSHFIMGCLQSGVDVNIVRLTFRGGVATARLMPSSDLRALMRNPLLRSTNVVSALFHESVIVSESDTDRAFYQEINERLLREDKGRGIPNAIFLNAQNKQTIQTIINPLRKLGIPAAAIYDIDLLKDGGGTATSFLSSAGVPDLARSSFSTLRAAVLAALQATGKNFKKEGGIDLLENTDKEAAQSLLDQLESYGAFVVPQGELESWLTALGVSGHGPNWLIPIFEKMGEDPAAADYVLPAQADVWDFMARIRTWLHDPDRKGIPQ